MKTILLLFSSLLFAFEIINIAVAVDVDSSSQQDRYLKALEYVSSNGAVVSDKLEYRNSDDGRGSGFFARRAIARDEQLLLFPYKATLQYTADIVRMFPQLASLDNASSALFAGDGRRALWALGVALLHQRQHPATLLYPLDCHNAVTFAQQATRDRRFVDAILTLQTNHAWSAVTQHYNAVRRLFPTLSQSINQTLYRKAYCWYETRSFNRQPHASDDATIMIPVADLFNHNTPDGVVADWKQDIQHQSWRFFATKVCCFVLFLLYSKYLIS
jgi:hypothetical protein